MGLIKMYTRSLDYIADVKPLILPLSTSVTGWGQNPNLAISGLQHRMPKPSIWRWSWRSWGLGDMTWLETV